METALTVLIWAAVGLVGLAGLVAVVWLAAILIMIFVLKQGGKG